MASERDIRILWIEELNDLMPGVQGIAGLGNEGEESGRNDTSMGRLGSSVVRRQEVPRYVGADAEMGKAEVGQTPRETARASGFLGSRV